MGVPPAESGAGRAARPLAGRRVLFVLGTLELGGAERQALLLARHLASWEEADVAVWGLGADGPVSDLCRASSIPVRSVPLRWFEGRLARWRSLLAFGGEVKRHSPEIVLPYTAIPNVACGVVARRSGARLCVWNQRDEGLGHPAGTLERIAAKRTSIFVANSKGSSRYLVERLRVSASAIRIVPNGVEAPRAAGDRAACRARHGLPGDLFAACMIANLHDNKDHETLLRAWRIALGRPPLAGRPALLILAGRPGNTASRCRDLAADLGLAESVRFAGAVEDVGTLLLACDLSILSSRSEGCPNGVLESMAAGLPVAGSDVAGIREALGDGASDLLAPPGDADSLADRISSAARDQALRARLGEANRRRAAREFAPRRMLGSMTALLVEGLGRDSS